MQTILITGASSGYGLETARYFLANGWRVIATMRQPDPNVLPRSEALRILPLDVTQPDSIAAAIVAAGPIDALVTCRVGVVGAFELRRWPTSARCSTPTPSASWPCARR